MSWGEQTRGAEAFKIGKPQPWTQDALCAQIGGDHWYPEKGEARRIREAKMVCRMCPVVAECLSFALDKNERYGVWGAKSERERRKLRRTRDPEPGMQPLDPARCGTPAQAKAHARRGEPPCTECRLAANRDKLARNHKRRGAA